MRPHTNFPRVVTLLQWVTDHPCKPLQNDVFWSESDHPGDKVHSGNSYEDHVLSK